MKIASMQLGMYMTNCYLVSDEKTKSVAVIDPGAKYEKVLDYVNSEGLTVKYIFLTHGHFDHTGAVADLHRATGAPVYMNEKDIPQYGDKPDDVTPVFYSEGDEVKMDSVTFRVLETPGHTPGSVVLLAGDAMFAGDTLFAGSCGRTDFPGGSYAQMLKSLRRLAELDVNYQVFPGHERASTLEIERQYNPFVREALGN